MSSRALHSWTWWKSRVSLAVTSRRSRRSGSLAGSDFLLRAANLEHRPVLEPDRRKAPSPDAATVQGEQVVAHMQSQRRPVAADDDVVHAAPPGHVEPRRPWLARFAGLALVGKHHRALVVANAKPRKRIDDDAQPVGAAQALLPAIRLVAVHALEEPAVTRATQGRLDFACERARLLHRPDGQDRGMHQHVSVFDVHQRAITQPRKQLFAIGRAENIVKRVA